MRVPVTAGVHANVSLDLQRRLSLSHRCFDDGRSHITRLGYRLTFDLVTAYPADVRWKWLGGNRAARALSRATGRLFDRDGLGGGQKIAAVLTLPAVRPEIGAERAAVGGVSQSGPDRDRTRAEYAAAAPQRARGERSKKRAAGVSLRLRPQPTPRLETQRGLPGKCAVTIDVPRRNSWNADYSVPTTCNFELWVLPGKVDLTAPEE